VIQEWWGLTDHIADVADRLAAEGFVALAPDLYGGRTAHDADEAGALMSALPVDRSAQELGGAVDYGERDDFYPADAARAQEEQIRAESGAPVEFHFYDAGHAFHNDTDALGTYSPEDARTAWTRTVEFLRTQLT
jgi:dienelactone hydrolase